MPDLTSTGTMPPDEPDPPTPEEIAAATAVDPVHDEDWPDITTYDPDLPAAPNDHGPVTL